MPTTRRARILIVAVALLAGAGCRVSDPAPGQTLSVGFSFVTSPTAVDIPYVEGAQLGCPGWGSDHLCLGSQTLDIYKAPGDGAHPVILLIHGGGWSAGDKAEVGGEALRQLGRGYDVVSVNYRLANGVDNLFPAAVLDVKAAVRWVKANAADLGFDPSVIIAWGHSAGGHLAQMLATTAGEAPLEPVDGLTPAMVAEDSRVAAAVSLAGPSNWFTFVADGHAWSYGLTVAFLGCYDNCDARKKVASPAAYVSTDDAPIYAAFGAWDAIAYPRHGAEMEQRYLEVGRGDVFWLDVVDSGDPGCVGHNVACGFNVAVNDLFVDWVRDGRVR